MLDTTFTWGSLAPAVAEIYLVAAICVILLVEVFAAGACDAHDADHRGDADRDAERRKDYAQGTGTQSGGADPRHVAGQ